MPNSSIIQIYLYPMTSGGRLGIGLGTDFKAGLVCIQQMDDDCFKMAKISKNPLNKF